MSSGLSVHIDKLTKKTRSQNYDTWKLQIEAILTKNDCWNYANGTTKKPSARASEITAWEKHDQKARADIILAMSTLELCHVKGCKTSNEIWKKLKEKYQSKGPVRKGTLFKQLLFTKMKESQGMSQST